MGKSGVITIESKDNQVYHDVAVLFLSLIHISEPTRH